MEEEMPKTNLASFLHRPWYRRSDRMRPLRSTRADEPRGGLGRVCGLFLCTSSPLCWILFWVSISPPNGSKPTTTIEVPPPT